MVRRLGTIESINMPEDADVEDASESSDISGTFAHENDDDFKDEAAEQAPVTNIDCESVVSSSGRTSTSNRDDKELTDDDELMTPKIAAKEARAVWASKVLVAIVLLISAGILAYFSYSYTRKEEENEFQAKVRACIHQECVAS